MARLIDIGRDGFRNATLGGTLGFSLFRVLVGFLLGALVGIPLGYAMGLSGWFRGWFDPIVEFMRPVPPLALIPLVIIWAGIGEVGKIVLLFLASLGSWPSPPGRVFRGCGSPRCMPPTAWAPPARR